MAFLQGALEFLKIPYTGSKVLASALCMNKVFFKNFISSYGFLTAPYQVISKNEFQKNFKCNLKFPVVLKPSNLGSSVGVSICHKPDELLDLITQAFEFDFELLLEEYIDGAELAVSFLNGKALTPVEIVPLADFYDYERKYQKGKTDYFIPARFKKEVLENLKSITKKWRNFVMLTLTVEQTLD